MDLYLSEYGLLEHNRNEVLKAFEMFSGNDIKINFYPEDTTTIKTAKSNDFESLIESGC